MAKWFLLNKKRKSAIGAPTKKAFHVEKNFLQNSLFLWGCFPFICYYSTKKYFKEKHSLNVKIESIFLIWHGVIKPFRFFSSKSWIKENGKILPLTMVGYFALKRNHCVSIFISGLLCSDCCYIEQIFCGHFAFSIVFYLICVFLFSDACVL